MREAFAAVAPGTSLYRYVDDYLIIHRMTSSPAAIGARPGKMRLALNLRNKIRHWRDYSFYISTLNLPILVFAGPSSIDAANRSCPLTAATQKRLHWHNNNPLEFHTFKVLLLSDSRELFI